MKIRSLLLSSLFIPSFMFSEEISAECDATSMVSEECCQPFCLDKSGRFEVYGDYLLWNVREDQLSYAQVLQGGIASILNPFAGGGTPGQVGINITTREADFDWKSGFRVGGGYTLDCDNWDFQLSWTQLHQETSSNFADPNNGIIPSNFPASLLFNILSTALTQGAVAPTLASAARNEWNFHFDTVDFQVGKSFFHCCSVGLRPYLGVKGAWINQKLSSSYDGIALTIDGNRMPIGVRAQKRNNFHAVGPSFGIDMAWEFYSDFSLVSDLSFAALYGKFRNNIASTLIASSVGSQINSNITDNNHRLRPMVDGSIGFEWNNCSWQCLMFTIGASYEVQYWWNQWQVPSSSELELLTGSTSAQGDLMMHGLTVHVGVAY